MADEDSELDDLVESWLKLNLQGLPADWHIGLDLSGHKAQVAATIGIGWETYVLCCCGPRGREWKNGKALPAVRRAAARLELDHEIVETVIQVFF